MCAEEPSAGASEETSGWKKSDRLHLSFGGTNVELFPAKEYLQSRLFQYWSQGLQSQFGITY